MRLLTVKEAGEILGVRLSRAYELIRLGIIPAARLGRQLRVPEAAITEIGEEALRRWKSCDGAASEATIEAKQELEQKG